MPSRCTGCGKIHSDKADYLMKGCDACGSKFFFFVKKESLELEERRLIELTYDEIKEIEEDIRNIIPEEEKNETVVLELEAIHVTKPGKYLIDVTNLFKQRPLVIRIGAGKYKIDLSTLTTKFRERIKKPQIEQTKSA